MMEDERKKLWRLSPSLLVHSLSRVASNLDVAKIIGCRTLFGHRSGRQSVKQYLEGHRKTHSLMDPVQS